MPSRWVSVFVLVAMLCLPLARAQEASDAQPLAALAAHATFHTDFTFDKAMLNAMSQNLPDDERNVVAQLRSVRVNSFRYSSASPYDPAALDAVRAQYAAEGWQHLVTKQTHPQNVTDPPSRPDPTRTDVWVRLNHSNVDGIVLLVANDRNVNLVTVDGTISPLDLLHLRGHFGIPRFSGDQFENAK